MKKLSFLTLALLLCLACDSSVSNDSGEVNQTIIREGVGLGSVIAVVLSWERNKSILWAILHGILSWFYIIYYALTRKSPEGTL